MFLKLPFAVSFSVLYIYIYIYIYMCACEYNIYIYVVNSMKNCNSKSKKYIQYLFTTSLK